MRRRTMILILALTLPVAALGRSAEDRLARFQLYNGCQPFELLVEDYSSDEDYREIGLTGQAIQNLAESRLRAARLYTDTDSPQNLYININVVGRAFGIDLDFRKIVYDPASDSRYYAASWSTGSTGTHGNDSGYILSNLSKHMDEFMVEYLRANEDACG